MLGLSQERILDLFFPPKCHACGHPLGGTPERHLCRDCAQKVRPIQPPFCRVCGLTAPVAGYACGPCQSENFAFDRAFACVYYDEPIRRLMHDFKFGRMQSVSRFFGRLLCNFSRAHLFDGNQTSSVAPQAVIGVPLDIPKRRWRGFSQSVLLAEHVGSEFGLRDLSTVLVRLGSGRDQARLARRERLANIKDCFAVADPGVVSGKRLL
ncbi:MAG: double zinc ribbon domain-containing protein, partial [Candidatus Omnitrophota bacterium]